MVEFFDVQKPIQMSVWQGSVQVWYDAKVLSAWVNLVDDEGNNVYRPALNFTCEYYTSDDIYSSKLFDVLGSTSDNWRYKEN